MMRIIITGGGTGGHIYPAISICQTIIQNEDDPKVLFVGKKDSLEEELTKKAGLPFCYVDSMGFPRKIGKKMIISLMTLLKGIGQSKKIIKDFKPDIVMGTGGYVSLPMMIEAQRMKIPTALHEANSIPGLANKLVSKKCKYVFITLEEARDRINTNGEIVLSGNPVRKEFLKEGNSNIKLDKDRRLILSFGGSGGQRGLNNAVKEIIKKDLLTDDLMLIHITGKNHFNTFIEDLGNYREDKYRVLDYSYEMPSLIKEAKLIISSSGMMTLTEISASGKPSILIPKPYTTENHQVHNALSYQKEGASEIILESDLTYETLSQKILDLMKKSDKLIEMGRKSKELFKENSNIIIYEKLKTMIK